MMFHIFSKVDKRACTHMCVYIILFLIFTLGLFFRLYHIEFGLPHSFHADEPEIAEFAIKYTYEFRSIIKNTEYYRLIPLNFVYGTVPTYFLTMATMLFSKTSNFLNSEFDKTSLYIFMRSLTAVFAALIIPITALIYTKLFKNTKLEQKSMQSGIFKTSSQNEGLRTKVRSPIYTFLHNMGLIFVTFFTALNWKLIVHAHYINVDIYLTLFLSLAYLFAIMYFKKNSDTKYTILTAIFFGLAVGTKITALLGLLPFLYLFLVKRNGVRDVRGMFAFLFVVFGIFVITNPFSLILAQDFAFRVLMLTVKENGLVFDSVDFGTFKYIYSLTYLVTPIVFLLFLYIPIVGFFIKIKDRAPKTKIRTQISDVQFSKNRNLHIFLFSTIAIYLVFFSLGTRRVDRWLLPILPIVFVYASFSMHKLAETLKPRLFVLLTLVVLITYSYYPTLLLKQFSPSTPKSESYLWLRDNIPPESNKLVITKEGLDPLNKLKGVNVINYEVYESEAAQFSLPESPKGYDYVIISSRPLEIYKNRELQKKYKFYTDAWENFENTLQDETQFELIKSFVLPKPNLIELSDVFVYKNLNSQNSNN